MTYYVAEHVMVNPLQMKDNDGERRGRKRVTQSLGGHMTRWRCVWTRMGFCAADNLNASDSTMEDTELDGGREMRKRQTGRLLGRWRRRRVKKRGLQILN